MIKKVQRHSNKCGAQVYVQYAINRAGIPSPSSFRTWVCAALEFVDSEGDVVIRVVDEAEGFSLNRRYRGKAYATNVLSFPVDVPAGVDTAQLGDLVICAPVVAAEAQAQGKTKKAHWAHMVVHGVLHLLGYDHQQEREAALMESKEIAILQQLGFSNPYGEQLA